MKIPVTGDKIILEAGVYRPERCAAEVLSVVETDHRGTRFVVEALNGASFVVGLEDMLLAGMSQITH